MYTKTLFIFVMLSFVHGQDRKITSKLNPGCTICMSNTTLVYVRADGSKDTIHQIWDFTRGIPTMILTVGSLTSSLNIVWDGTEPRRFNFNETKKYSFATAIDKLFEYDDLEDLGYIDKKSPQHAISLDRTSWQMLDSVMTESQAMVHMRSGHLSKYDHKGYVEIKLTLLPFKDYAVDLPHLIHTSNSTLAEARLVNITTRGDYNAARFAIHMLLVSTDSALDTMHCDIRKSLDDEHTPGVFEIVEVQSPGSYERSSGGFIQFRPVAYTQRERSVTSSTVVHVSDFTRLILPARSTLSDFYRNYENEDLLMQGIFISFGEPGDGYYRQHNYTAWSYTFGYGAPPLESFSLFVIMIISIGLGVPVLLALSGIVFVLVRRYRGNTPRRFVDDD